MKKYVILTESGTDLPKELASQYHIHVLPMHIAMGNMQYSDGAIPVTQVYSYYDKTGCIPKTSAVNPIEYLNCFEQLKKENPDSVILHIGYSSKASCTFQNARIASDGMDYVYHVDSLNVSGGEAAIVLKAAELVEQQPDIQPEELVKTLEAYTSLARVSFIPGNLEYLKAGGRVSNAAYLGASILQLKPLIEILDGELISTKRFRGSISRIAEKYLNEYIDRYNMEKEQIYLLYSFGLDESVKQRMEEIAAEKGFKKIIWIQTGCVISIHSGPGAIGVAGFEANDIHSATVGKERKF